MCASKRHFILLTINQCGITMTLKLLFYGYGRPLYWINGWMIYHKHYCNRMVQAEMVDKVSSKVSLVQARN